jgi:hypothetical protein
MGSRRMREREDESFEDLGDLQHVMQKPGRK